MAGGTAFGQLIVALGSPIVTRLYLPEEFGVLAVYASLLGTVVGASSLRYDIAIPLPSNDRAAANLLALSLLALGGVAFGIGVAAWLTRAQLAAWTDAPALSFYMWLLPIGLVGAGTYRAFNYWAVRAKAYGAIAQTKVSQSVGMTGSQIGLGAMGGGPAALIVGQIIGQSAGVGSLGRVVWRFRVALRGVSWRRMRVVALRYRHFPLYSGPGTLCNSAGLYLPALFFAALYGPQVAGWYALAERVTRKPVSLVGRSVSDVYLGEASRYARENPRALRHLFKRIVSKLALLALGPTLLLALFGAQAFEIVFGEAWQTAGYYAQLLAPMLLARFVISPVSQTLNIIEEQRLQAAWEVGRLLAVLGCFGLVYALRWVPSYGVAAFSASMVVCYSALLGLSWKKLATL